MYEMQAHGLKANKPIARPTMGLKVKKGIRSKKHPRPKARLMPAQPREAPRPVLFVLEYSAQSGRKPSQN